MTPENKYSKVLLELKTRYQKTLVELETQTSQIKTKITSLDTLIEDPVLGSDLFSILQGEVDSLTSADSAPAPKMAKAVKPKAEAKPKETAPKASPASGKRKPSTSPKSASAPKNTKTGEPKAEASQKVSPSSSKTKSATPKKAASEAAAKKKKQNKANNTSSSIRPMQWPYTEMSKIDAIEKIMQVNIGNSLHVEDLILQLYGELSGDELKAERNRMNKTMYTGTQQNRWVKSSEEPMSYRVEDNSQVKPKESKTTKTKKSQQKT